MSVPMSLLALLEEAPSYGLQLKQAFETCTGDMWPLNVGQVYTTLGRLERDGLVEQVDGDSPGDDRLRIYRITEAGRRALGEWFHGPSPEAPTRDGLVLKIVLAATRLGVDPAAVIQTERRAAIIALQEYTRLKAGPPAPADLGWLLLLDSLIFKVESRIRWLDAAEARLASQPAASPTNRPDAGAESRTTRELSRP